MKSLIIGYGNTLRNDDGVGVRVAETIGAKNWPDTRAIAAHQLTPELAEEIAGCERVIFVDAIVTEGLELRVERLESSPLPGQSAHALDPGSLLALTGAIYGKVPIAWGIFIPAIDREFGEKLSEVAREGMGEAIEAIERIVHGEKGCSPGII